MATKKQELLQSYIEYQEQAFLQLEDVVPDKDFIWKILYTHFDLVDTPEYVIYENLTASRIVEIVTNYLRQNGAIVDTIEITEYTEPFVVSGGDLLEKAEIKISGHKWVVHKNDVDPFPSSPHAHEYELNVKLDLSTGKMYKKKDTVGKLHKNDLKRLRMLIQQRIQDISLPNL